MKTKKDGLDKACRAYYQIHSGFFFVIFFRDLFSRENDMFQTAFVSSIQNM